MSSKLEFFVLDDEYTEFEYREEEGNNLSGKFLVYLFVFIIILFKVCINIFPLDCTKSCSIT